MGYFSNGSEGEFYETAVCERCAHYIEPGEDGMCPVWEIHLLYNYGQEDGTPLNDILSTLIPRQGIQNGLCSMWHPAKPEWANHGKDYQDWLKSKGQPHDG